MTHGRIVVICTLLIAVIPGAGSAATKTQAKPSEKILQLRERVFYHLEPRVTKAQIERAVGKPDTEYVGRPSYRMRRGAVTLGYENGGLVFAHHYFKPNGEGFNRSLYWRMRPTPPTSVLDRRDRWIATRQFDTLSRWGFGEISAFGTRGFVYLLHDGYLAIERLDQSATAGASGWLNNRLAKVTLRRNGRITVLYRASDEWSKFRPARLSDSAVARRESALRKYRSAITDPKNLPKLGMPDGKVGSGIVRSLYWLRDGLLLVVPAGGAFKRGDVRLWQPGAERQTSFDQWRHQPWPRR